MSDLVLGFGLIEIIVLGVTLLVFVTEQERLPGTWRRWMPIQWRSGERYGQDNVLVIGIKRRNEKISLVELDLNSSNFENDLIKAEQTARERCIQLNVSNKKLRKQLPR